MFFSPFIVFSLVFTGTALPVESAAELRELTSANFDDSVREGIWFVEFFSPKCSHCRAFAPTWEKLVQYVDAQSNPGISLAQVNCLAQGDLCQEHSIRAYPSLVIYEDGAKEREFTEDREYERLTMFIDAHARKAPPKKSLNEAGKVLSLNYNTFHSTIDDGPILIKFFAPWCGHCKKLAPAWIEFASEMKGKVNVAEVNCDEQKGLCKMQKIKGYPTILLYQHGQTIEFTGARKLDALKKFADAALAPPLSRVSIAELEETIKKQSVVYVVVHEKLADSIQDVVEDASKPLHGTPPVVSIQVSPDVLSFLGLPANQPLPVLVCLKDHAMRSFDSIVLSSTSTKAELSDWLIQHSLPSSTQLDADNFARIMGSPSAAPSIFRLTVIAAINHEDFKNIEELQRIAEAWLQQHKSLDGKVVFTWMDRDKWASWLKSAYGVKTGSDAAVVLVDHSQLLYYDTFPTGQGIELTYESINEAIEAVRRGSLKPKHSENVLERFARHLNNKIQNLGNAISEHPIRSIFFFCLVISGIFYVIKRIVDNDTKRYGSIHPNRKGTRLD